MKGKEEYLFLREEILKEATAVQNYRNVMYASIAAIYTFAFTQSEPLVFLVPIFVIMPIYKICTSRTSAMCRIGAYLLVFLEGDEFHWETRLHKYDEVYEINVKKSTISPYTISVLTSGLLCFIRIDFANFYSLDNIARVSICVLVCMYCVITIRKNQINYIKEKDKYIERWMHIQKKEEANRGTS